MHLHFERNSNAKCDCTILNLTWMGKVPDELPEEEGWKLNRINYYQEGWLASGNVRGIVGVTFTASHCKKPTDSPLRTNYNLRGHRSPIVLVRWNEPYQKLASCDSSGIIFVWVKYEGRWSVELINDRGTPVTHFAWSHDGRMALICYKDGFVLVGSVAGQRYWSSMLNLKSTVTCGIWTPDDQQVYFGTSSGQMIVMDVTGAMVSQVQLGTPSPTSSTCSGITCMAWSCEKFKMEETDENPHSNAHPDGRLFMLAVSLDNGIVILMKQYDDVSPITIQTGMQSPVALEWSNSGEILAVAGWCAEGSCAKAGQPPHYNNMLKCYSDSGNMLCSVPIPSNRWPVSALTWGHNDKRLFIATGCQVHIAWVSRRIPSLHLLCRLRIYNHIPGEHQIVQLPIPSRLQLLVASLFSQTIRCCVPESCDLREFVSQPPKGNIRLHCTMMRHGDESSLMTAGTCYTLYLEYLGGLVPLLKGKRTSKIRPEFVIFDPQQDINQVLADEGSVGVVGFGLPGRLELDADPDSDSERDEGCASPRMGRRRHAQDRRARARLVAGIPSHVQATELVYRDTLPEEVQLVQVTSNIWGTKFKIHGLLGGTMPANLGQITYKTSLLHLQPRQMTLCMTEMRDDLPLPISQDANFNPHLFSEDEEDTVVDENGRRVQSTTTDLSAAIAPMLTPRNQRKASHHSIGREAATQARPTPPSSQPSRSSNMGIGMPALARAESYTDDEFPYPNYNESFQRSSAGLSHAAPALQSPKNSVAPLVSTPPSAPDYSVGVHRVKSALADGATNPGSRQHYLFQSDLRVNGLCLHLEEQQTQTEKAPATRQAGTQSSPSPTRTTPSASGRGDPLTSLGLRFIDDELGEVRVGPVRSCSAGFLDQAAGSPGSAGQGAMVSTKRLVLTTRKARDKHTPPPSAPNTHDPAHEVPLVEPRQCSKSRSLDIFPGGRQSRTTVSAFTERNTGVGGCPESADTSAVPEECATSESTFSPQKKFIIDELAATAALPGLGATAESPARLSQATSSLPPPPNSPRLAHSTPTSPMPSKKSSKRTLSSSPIRQRILNSPLLMRRNRRNKSTTTESTDDEDMPSGDEGSSGPLSAGRPYSNLESFQKAQLRQKLKRGKARTDVNSVCSSSSGSSCGKPQRAEFIMHNKTPMWNENSQVYQLDFAGRVTQESAKNFQIEFHSKQVMQFGRIDGNAYTLDFQYPFSALQAFAVALANITQRLK